MYVIQAHGALHKTGRSLNIRILSWNMLREAQFTVASVVLQTQNKIMVG